MFEEPGCKTLKGSEKWLQRNIGIFLEYATIQELKEMNNNFSAVSDILYFENIYISLVFHILQQNYPIVYHLKLKLSVKEERKHVLTD